MTARLFACLAIFFAAQSADSPAKKPERVSPKAQNIEVEVARGESVRIPLRGFERNLNPLTYRPLGRPQHGKLSGLEPYNGPERQGPAYITYTHGNDEDSVADTFAFEVKAGITKLTGRGRVIIKIRDAAPLLSITPELLDFGPVALGDPPVRCVVELANAGGGVITGFLRPTEPFTLEDDGGFVLRRGKKTRIPLLFAPERTGEFVFRLQPFANDPALLVLKGLAIAPLVLEVEEAVFSAAPDQSRRGIAVVKNQSKRPLTVSVGLPPESPVEAVADFTLGPGESTEVILRIPPDRKEYVPPFGASFECDGHAELREFTAPAIPAALRIVATPDFGEVRPRTVVRASLILINDGGSPAEGKLLPSESIRPASGATAFTVPPGGELEIPLELRLKPDQAPPTEMTVSLLGKEVIVKVTARLIPRTPTPPPTPTICPKTDDYVLNYVLNIDIRYTPTPEGPAITWVEKPGWQDFTLQHRRENDGLWQDYHPPAPHEGPLGWLQRWLQSLAGLIRKFLDTPIERADPTAEPSNEAPTGQQLIAESHLAADQWRLVATLEGGDKRDVALPFRIRDNTLVGIPAQPDRLPPPPTGPVTAFVYVDKKAERLGAFLEIFFAHDLGVSSFRLERGIPGAPTFKIIDRGEKNGNIGKVTGNGLELTVCRARIDGLPRGTRTYWRVVPTGPSGELAPTIGFFVDTLPVTPFPWRTVAISALCAVLAGALYLRWRLNRPPR